MQSILRRILRSDPAHRSLAIGQRVTTQAWTAEVIAVFPSSKSNPGYRLVVFKPDDGMLFSRFVSEDGTVVHLQLPTISK